MGRGYVFMDPADKRSIGIGLVPIGAPATALFLPLRAAM